MGAGNMEGERAAECPGGGRAYRGSVVNWIVEGCVVAVVDMPELDFDRGSKRMAAPRPHQLLAIAEQDATVALGAGGINALVALNHAIGVTIDRTGGNVAEEVARPQPSAAPQAAAVGEGPH